MSKTLDRVDRRILDELQGDARVSQSGARQAGGLIARALLAKAAVPREEGFINGYATLLNGPAVGLPILAYTLVSLENHHPETIREFDQLVKDRPEILECHSMSGPNDYLLRIVAASMEAYERLHVLTRPADQSGPRDEHELRVAHEEVHHAVAGRVRSARLFDVRSSLFRTLPGVPATRRAASAVHAWVPAFAWSR